MTGHSSPALHTICQLFHGWLDEAVIQQALQLEPHDLRLVGDVLWELCSQVRPVLPPAAAAAVARQQQQQQQQWLGSRCAAAAAAALPCNFGRRAHSRLLQWLCPAMTTCCVPYSHTSPIECPHQQQHTV
jgi:hypothetical protein